MNEIKPQRGIEARVPAVRGLPRHRDCCGEYGGAVPSVPLRWALALVLVVGMLGLLSQPAQAWLDEEQFNRDLREITSHPTRVIGSDGYYATGQYLESQFGQLPNVEWRRHEFPVMVPVTKEASMVLPGGEQTAIHPFWPAQIRHNATPAGGITGRVVYVGDASFSEIPAAALHGQIAVVESTAGLQWRQAVYFGARAVLVLGGEEMTNTDLRHHELTVPVNIPRFYVPEGEVADQLRAGRIDGEVTLRASVNWETRTAANYYALVRPPLLEALGRLPTAAQWAVGSAINPGPAGHAHSTAPAALMISVPYDSSGLVPDASRGASQAVQTASGLALLRDLSKQPLNRPVVVFFGGADSIQFLGTRNMFLAFGEVPATWRRELDELNALEESELRRDLERIRMVKADPLLLDATRDSTLIDRIVKLIETDIMHVQERLFTLRTKREEERTEAMAAEEQALEDRQAYLSRLRFGFQQSSDGRPLHLQEMLLESGGPFIERTERRLVFLLDGQAVAERREQLEQRVELYRWLADRLYRDPDPGTRTNNSRLIELLVGLDLSDRGVRVGPLYWGQFQRASNISHIQDFREWFSRVDRAPRVVQTEQRREEESIAAGRPAERTPDQERDVAEALARMEWFEPIRPLIDLEPLSGVRSPQSWLCASMPIASELAQGWGVPGFSMITLDDLRLRRDTPADTLENLDVSAILPQLHGVRTLLWQAWNDPRFRGPVELRWMRNGFRGQVVSQAAGRPVPDLPREGFLVTYYYVGSSRKIPALSNLPYTMGIRRNEVRSCDAEGNYRFEGLPRFGTPRHFVVQVYRIEPDTGEVTATSDLGKTVGEVRQHVDLHQQDITPVRSLVFNCTEFTLVGLYDPRFLQDLGEVIPLDARRNAEPQRFNILLSRQLMAGYLEPGTSSYLIFRYGRVGNRLILVNMMDPGEAAVGMAGREERHNARGFTIDQLNNMEPLALATSTDFWRLNSIRLENYRRAGVFSSLIDHLQRQSAGMLDEARAAYAGNRGDGVVRDANGAWASQARVYQAAEDMARDVVRAAIFLLLLCVPFAFCMERLLLGAPNIYRQIGFAFAIFGLMMLALWSFHPAFQISASPLIIILAFAIIFMSVVVISVVYSKFDTELKRIRSGRGSAEGASFARASVLMSAVLLGIANMRKRKFRTALTSITIILITFAVLAFTSSTRYLDTTTLPTGIATDHPGVMLRQRGFRPMPPVMPSNLQAVMGRQQQIVQRWWNINAGDPKEQFHVVAVNRPVALADAEGSEAVAAAVAQAARGPRIFAAQAILGLSPGESRLSRIGQVVENYDRLENGEERIIYFSHAIAEQLEVGRGDTVLVGGIELEVAGLFDANEFDQRVVTLSGEQIAPLEYASGMLDAGGRALTDTAAESLDLDADTTVAELAQAYQHLPATQFVIVPSRISRMLPNSSLRTVAMRLEPAAAVRTVGERIGDIAGEVGQGVEPVETARLLVEEALSVIAGRSDAWRLERELLRLREQIEGGPDLVALSERLHDTGQSLREFDPVKEVSDELAKRFAVAMYAGYEDGVRMVAASNLASVSGAGQVAIPLAIAGLIIFNTMMGSIAERRREIHVYTSLGLAPLHVGALFVAEAMTYGLIGAVFGYVIGQGAGTAMLHLGWLGGVTLNYSGTAAMLTMGLILVVVLLSALVPARLASQIAAPSIDRTWRVPLPKGDQIVAQLPFTINKTAADGALAYLAEFFDYHQEGSIGKFSAGKVESITFEDDQGRPSRGLKTVIWLTPFDLGVRQHLMMLIHPGQYEDIYEVQVVLQRISGDDGSWYRMNRTFLTELRKQFLQWRSLTPQRMMEYVEESRQLFERSERVEMPASLEKREEEPAAAPV